MERLQPNKLHTPNVNSDLNATDSLITEDEEIIQQTSTMGLSQQRNDRSDPYQSLSDLIKNLKMT